MGRKRIPQTMPNVKLSKTVKSKDLAVKNPVEYRQESKPDLEWTQEEVNALNLGVTEFGTRSWKKILRKYRDVFKNRRRVVDLVHKYRLIKKQTSYYTTEKRSWIEVNEKNTPVTDAMGEMIMITTKFPYDAAKMIAKKKIRNGETSFIVRLREGVDLEKVHVYSGNKEPGQKLCLKKLAI